jgi:hypothetical protein
MQLRLFLSDLLTAELSIFYKQNGVKIPEEVLKPFVIKLQIFNFRVSVTRNRKIKMFVTRCYVVLFHLSFYTSYLSRKLVKKSTLSANISRQS